MILKNLGEFNFIKRISKDIKLSPDVIKGIGDDTAVLKSTKDRYLLLTSDMLLEDRHFKKKEKGYLVGKKALSVNISDIVSMGGKPKAAVVSLGVSPKAKLSHVDDIYRGIKNTAKKFNIDIVGGDTVSSEKLIINIALTGYVKKKDLVLRSGAKSGDAIFVTGTVGGSLRRKHLEFTPRLEEANFLVKNFKINSMIDVSDGLFADLGHILTASKKGAICYKEEIPVSKKAKNFQSAITDGEDFELIFTLPKKHVKKLKTKWPFKTRLSEIGKIISSTKKTNIKNINGYTHF